MGNIVLLDDLTINKIAAGEVIERPASVVKELVENSIDAGATNITIEIKNGGISYIRITDNGKGILPDDMEMAFERHATSKIRVAEDLEKVKSMGFRGEALASVAAISKIKMQSKTMDQDIGYQIQIEGGHVISKEETGCQNGTIIEIQDLFFNTPVRYKFLKKDFTESGYIEDAVTRLALVHPEIAMKLINTGKTVIQTPGNGDIKSVIYNIYGKDITENVIDVNYEFEDIKVVGVIGKPEIARSNRSNQLFFVNGRYVKDKILSSSAEQAYKEKLQAGKYGFLILNIEIDPSKIDVNVHPAKLEIRFSEEQKVFKAVYHAIKDELMKTGTSIVRNELEEQNETIHGFEEVKKEEQIKIEQPKQEEPRGLFKKFFSKKEENEEEDIKPTMMEELYETRRLNADVRKYDAPSFDSVISKMAEMQKTVREFKGIDEDEEAKDIKQENVIEKTIEEENKKEEIEIEKNKVIEENTDFTNIVEENNETQNENIESSEEIVENIIIENPITENTITDNTVIENENLENIEENNIQEDNTNLEETTEIQTPYVSNIYEYEEETKVITDEMKQEISENMEDEKNQVIDIQETNQDVEIKEEVNQEPEIDEAEKIMQEFDDMYASIFGTTPKKEKKVKEVDEEYKIDQTDLKTCENITIFNDFDKRNVPNYKFIGIAFSNYIIIEVDKEVFIIDQFAANEKILYEAIKENYFNEKNKDSQMMLLPDIIDLTSKEMTIARENMEVFRKSGFMLEEFGENTIKLMGVPSYCMELNTKDLFIEILNQINKVPMTEKEQIEERFISTLAKKISMQASKVESDEEAISLIDNLLNIQNPFVYESGKSVAVEMKKEDIEKKFSRR